MDISRGDLYWKVMCEIDGARFLSWRRVLQAWWLWREEIGDWLVVSVVSRLLLLVLMAISFGVFLLVQVSSDVLLAVMLDVLDVLTSPVEWCSECWLTASPCVLSFQMACRQQVCDRG